MTFFLPFVFAHRVINPLGLAVFSGDRGVVKSFPQELAMYNKGGWRLSLPQLNGKLPQLRKR